jgi:hypothetical protein
MRALVLVSLLFTWLISISHVAAQPVPQPGQVQVYSSWTQSSRLTDLSVTTSTQDQSFGAVRGPVAAVFNTGTNYAYVKFTTTAGSVTAATGMVVPPGSCQFLNVSGQSHVQAISVGGSTTLQVSVGAGFAGSCGGAGGGGGGGGSVTQGTTPWIESLSYLNGVALGSPSNFGTTPGAVSVPGVNASLFQGTAIISTTNGIYSNLLQGNAVISATNPLFANLSQGSVALSATNGIYANQLQGNAILSVANPSFASITDGTNKAAVKAASTAPAATDPALVVAISPNGPSPVSASSLVANLVIKGSGGSLYSFQVSADPTLSGAAWWVMIYNATTAPVDGGVTPLKCYAIPSGVTSLSGAFIIPIVFSTGIVIGVSTTGCFTKTASAHAFISGDAL